MDKSKILIYGEILFWCPTIFYLLLHLPPLESSIVQLLMICVLSSLVQRNAWSSFTSSLWLLKELSLNLFNYRVELVTIQITSASIMQWYSTVNLFIKCNQYHFASSMLCSCLNKPSKVEISEDKCPFITYTTNIYPFISYLVMFDK